MEKDVPALREEEGPVDDPVMGEHFEEAEHFGMDGL
jgi:hypothetical protein